QALAAAGSALQKAAVAARKAAVAARKASLRTAWPPPPVGARLRALREAAGLPRKEVAAASGLSGGGVEAIEADRFRTAWSSVVRLAAALGASLDTLAADAFEAAPGPPRPAVPPPHVGPRLQAIREAAGLSLADLAHRCGLGHATLV